MIFVLQLLLVFLRVSNPRPLGDAGLLQPAPLLALDGLHSLLHGDPRLGGPGGRLHSCSGRQADRAALGSPGDGHLLLHRQHRHSSDLLFRFIPDSVAKCLSAGVAVLCAFFYYLLYMCTFNTELLFEVHIHGLSGYLAGQPIRFQYSVSRLTSPPIRSEYRGEAGDARPHPGPDPGGEDHQQKHSPDSVRADLHHVGHRHGGGLLLHHVRHRAGRGLGLPQVLSSENDATVMTSQATSTAILFRSTVTAPKETRRTASHSPRCSPTCCR